MSAYELCHSKMQVGKKTPNSAWHNSKFQSVFDSSCEEAAGGQADLVSSPVTLSGRCRKSWVQNLRDGLLTSWRRWSCKEKRGSFYKEPLTWTGPFAGALSKDTLFSLWLNLCLSHSSSSPFSSTSSSSSGSVIGCSGGGAGGGAGHLTAQQPPQLHWGFRVAMATKARPDGENVFKAKTRRFAAISCIWDNCFLQEHNRNSFDIWGEIFAEEVTMVIWW